MAERPRPIESITGADLQCVQWVQWTRPGKGAVAYAVHPRDPEHTITGATIPADAVPALWDTFRHPLSLERLEAAHLRWRLSVAPRVPDGEWPMRQADIDGVTIRKRRGVLEVWWRGEVIMQVPPAAVDLAAPWIVRESEKGFHLWVQGRVVASNRRKR